MVVIYIQIKSILLVNQEVRTTFNDQVGGGGLWEGPFGREAFLRESMCVEGMS